MANLYTQRREGGFYSDLACERRRADTALAGVEYKKMCAEVGEWERIRITTEEGEMSIGRPMGNYDTLTLPRMDLMDADKIEDAKDEIAKELCSLCNKNALFPEKILVVGLGNRELTPDAIGPEAASMIEATMHIKDYDSELFNSLECSEIAVITPGVIAASGIETVDIVSGICNRIKPDVVFAIDALASRSPSRLGTTIQISDTGIFPASGLGMSRSPIDEKALGVPVIAIGVPTVINSRMFVVENREASAAENSGGMFVSPKEINSIVKNAAKIISGGINQAFGIF